MTLSNSTPAAPDLSYQTALRQAEPLTVPTETVTLPADVQAQVNAFFSKLQAADGAYTRLAEGFKTIWEGNQYPAEYRRVQAEQHLTQTLAALDADLLAAEQHLNTARDMVRQGTTPPLLGSPDVHELKLMNAREEVKTALEGLQPTDQRRALSELFEDAMRGSVGQVSPIAYFIAATDAYKRLLKDPATRAHFAHDQGDMLRRLLPPTAAPYLEARAALDKLTPILETAKTARYYTARDNGWT